MESKYKELICALLNLGDINKAVCNNHLIIMDILRKHISQVINVGSMAYWMKSDCLSYYNIFIRVYHRGMCCTLKISIELWAEQTNLKAKVCSIRLFAK